MQLGQSLTAFWAQHWRPVAWTASIAVVGGLGFFGYMKLVEGGFIKYNKWDRRVRGTLRGGPTCCT